MHNCKEICDKIEEYIEGDLTKKELRIIEAHLKKCPSCREEFEFARSVRKALKEVELPEPPNDFLERINIQLDKEIRKTVMLKKLFSFKSCTTIAACVMIALFLGLNDDNKLVKEYENNITVESTATPVTETFENEATEQTAEAESFEAMAEVVEDTVSEEIVPEAVEEVIPAEETVPTEEVEKNAEPTKKTVKKTVEPTRKTEAPAKTPASKKKESTPKPFSTPSTTPTGEKKEESVQAESAEEHMPMMASVEEEEPVAFSNRRDVEDEDNVQDKSAENRASGGGGGSSSKSNANSAKPASVGKVYVPSQNVGTASGIASGYGSINGGAYEMSAANYQKFMSALNKKGISASSEASVSGGTYRFQIVAQ